MVFISSFSSTMLSTSSAPPGGSVFSAFSPVSMGGGEGCGVLGVSCSGALTAVCLGGWVVFDAWYLSAGGYIQGRKKAKYASIITEPTTSPRSACLSIFRLSCNMGVLPPMLVFACLVLLGADPSPVITIRNL